jgi:peptide/nickel transport system permease protein
MTSHIGAGTAPSTSSDTPLPGAVPGPTIDRADRARKKNRRRGLAGAYIGGGMLAVLAVAAIVCRFFLDAGRIDPAMVLTAPTGEHLFGTDSAGRDVALRTFAAAAADLPLALGGTAIAMVVGTALGLLAGSGGRGSGYIMRVVDGFDAFPLLILILVIVQISGGGTAILLATIAILNIPRFIRLTRAESMHLRESRYVFYSQVIGTSVFYRLRTHILPNISGTILSQASTGAALALSAVGAMSFLGLGIAPPIPSWGSMIQAGSAGLTTGQWWPIAFPALALVYSIVALNLISDSLDAHFAKEVE